MTTSGNIACPSMIVGLGNPGRQYERNRHNAGFMVLDALAREAGPVQWDLRYRALAASVVLDGRRVLLTKPQTYMNASGVSVGLLAVNLALSAGDCLIVLDDVNLPFGRIRVRSAGSAGGHHGLESVLGALGTEGVPRVRLGIGEDGMPADKTEFVLSDFSPESESGLSQMIGDAAAAVKMIVSAGISRAMTVYNA